MKKDSRYQFIEFRTVGTGKYKTEKVAGLGFMSLGGGMGDGSYTETKEVKKEMALVFDKKLGIVKYTEIKK